MLEEIRASDPELEVVVVDDGSTDGQRVARAAGGDVARAALQPRNRRRRADRLPVRARARLRARDPGRRRRTARPARDRRVCQPILEGRADLVVGTRFVTGGGYRGTRLRRVGIRLFAAIVSLLVRQRISDTTSGFRAVNKKALRSSRRTTHTTTPRSSRSCSSRGTTCGCSRCPCRCASASSGSSSITALRSAYYMIKVCSRCSSGCFAATGLLWRSHDPVRISIFAAIAAVILLLVVLELIRSRRLQERYALLWLLTGRSHPDPRGLARPALLVVQPRRHCLSAVGALHPRGVLHPPRAAALLDGDLEALRAEQRSSRNGWRCSSTTLRSQKDEDKETRASWLRKLGASARYQATVRSMAVPEPRRGRGSRRAPRPASTSSRRRGWPFGLDVSQTISPS